MVEIHRNGIAFCRIRTLKLCLGHGWVGGRNAASGNLILITFEGIIIESMRNRHTAAWRAMGLLSGAGVLVGAWWVLGGWSAFSVSGPNAISGLNPAHRPPALTSSFSANVGPRCWLFGGFVI